MLDNVDNELEESLHQQGVMGFVGEDAKELMPGLRHLLAQDPRPRAGAGARARTGAGPRDVEDEIDVDGAASEKPPFEIRRIRTRVLLRSSNPSRPYQLARDDHGTRGTRNIPP
jgi:hypothetical protein